MSTVSVEMEIYLHVQADGTRELLSSDMSKYEFCGACLGKVTLVGTYEDIDKDPREAMTENLEAQLEQERADSQVRQNILLDRISKLKCLEYAPEAAA
jgi:hypothetical protein